MIPPDIGYCCLRHLFPVKQKTCSPFPCPQLKYFYGRASHYVAFGVLGFGPLLDEMDFEVDSWVLVRNKTHTKLTPKCVGVGPFKIVIRHFWARMRLRR